MFAGTPEITDMEALLQVVDGVLLTGARANVHPTRFKAEPHPGHEPYDEPRDALALTLAEVCVARGIPILGVCRGFQELNVAFGGSLHPEIRELPGRMNHRMPRLETARSIPIPPWCSRTGTTSALCPAALLQSSSAARPFASTRFTAKASWSPAVGSWWRALPRTAPLKRSALPMRRVSLWACNGMPSTLHTAIRLTVPCSRRSGKR